MVIERFRKCFALILTALCLLNLFGYSLQTTQCEDIRIPMCMSMQWNLTQLPNLMDQSSQQNARLKIEEYQPLVQDKCSEHLLFFLCAIFTPICTTNFHDSAIPPCREVCEHVKTGCEPVITSKYNKTWPTNIDCNTFPEYNNGVCISPEAIKLEGINEQLPATTGGKKTETGVTQTEKSCNCRKKTRLHMRRYLQANFGYVIKVAVDETRQVGNDSLIILTIKQILKNPADLRMKTNETLLLWTEGVTCGSVCPVVRKRKEYIIACSRISNARIGRLMFDTKTCMISRWKTKWIKTIEDWEGIAALPSQSKMQYIRHLRHAKKGRATRRAPSGDSL